MRQDDDIVFMGTSSASGGCPTLYVTRRGTVVVQGTTVTDPEALAMMRARGNGMPLYESAVEVPAELLPFIDFDKLQKLAFADENRPEFIVDPASAARLAELAEAVKSS